MSNSLVLRIIIAAQALFASVAMGAMADFQAKSLKVEVVVEDEAGALVDEANVSIRFHHTALQQKRLGKRYHTVSRVFRKNSPVVVDYTSLGMTAIDVTKEGYWSSGLGHLWRSADKISGHADRYSRTFRITLKKRINPRPLFVQRVDWMSVPEFGKPIGFDLEKADWVAPYGGGIHGDFFFTLNRKLGQGEVYEGTMDLSFTAPMDGIRLVDGQGGATSELLLGREAPLDGYQPVYSRSVGVSEEGGRLKLLDDPSREELEGYAGFWFRVRSVVNEETGELVRARYGKIDGFIDFAVRAEDEPAHIRFVYYLSPDDSPSLEFNGESLVENADLQGVTKH